jgi:hypothetical protein
MKGIDRGLMKGNVSVFAWKDWVKPQKSKLEESVTRNKTEFGTVNAM